MKKFWLFLSLTLLVCAVCVTAVSAADKVVYLADGGTGDGSSASAPVGTLTDAYTAIGTEGGTIVLCGTYTIGAHVKTPVHTGTVTITSVYGETDYRTSGATLLFAGSYYLRLQGETLFDNIKIVTKTGTPYVAANFNPITFGYNVQTVNSSDANTRLRVVGGSKSDRTVEELPTGQSSTMAFYSGYYTVFAFSNDVASLTHEGTMYITVGGTASIVDFWVGIYNSTTSYGGTADITFKDSAKVTNGLYMAGNKTGMYLNGDITVRVQNDASIAVINYSDKETRFPNHTRTLEITGDNTTLPEGYADHFDIIVKDNVQVKPEPEVTALDTVFVASGGTGDGSAADKPIASLADAYALLDPEKGGTIVLCGDYLVSSSILVPEHTGTVKITSVYGGVDYRETNSAAFRITGNWVFRFMGPTELDGLKFVISANKTATIAANYNPLTIGTDVQMVDTDGAETAQMRVTGGPYNAATVPVLAAGESSSLTINGGTYSSILAFSYSVTDYVNEGTMDITLGGNVKTEALWFSVASSSTSYGGTVNATLKNNANIGILYLGGNNDNMYLNGDATVNLQDTASIGEIKYSSWEDPEGKYTSTLNITGDNTSLPVGFGECFDVITKDGQPYEEPVINYDVVFVADDGTGDGTSADAPVTTLAEAYTLLNTDGGTIVICGKLSITAHTTLPAHTNAVTITSVYGGVDYRTTNDAQLYSDVWHILHFYGETVLKDLTINLDVSFGMAMHYYPMTVDTGVVINANYDTDNGGRDANGLYIVGADINGTKEDGVTYDKDTNITIRSGTVSRVIGFGRYSGARHYEGHSTITVEGTGYVRYLYAGAVADDATGTTATINIREQATVERVHTGGSSKTNYMYGEVIINIDEMDGYRHDTNPDGGKIMEFDTMCIYANKGGVTMYYDASTVPEGALYLAELAKFDHILPACERTGKTHNYGADYANPYGGDAMLRKCATCEHIEFVGDAPAKVADGVIFVADGGFGDGSHPTFPLGSYADAMEQLKATGGIIVLIDTVTLAANYEYKFGTEEDCYQEPAHTEAILVTSVYDNVDYRESGAKLVFDGNMNYKTSGTVTFDGIVFDAVDSTGNILAARYNKLVVGKDVTMTDAISLTVVGGYQTFSYTDYVDVYIEDEWLRFSSPAVKVDTFELPDMEYLVMHEDYPTTGFTKEPYARKAAAESFNTMLADMVAATDENGESLGLKYPFIKSAMQSYEHKHDYISRYWARTWREHPEWSWEQVYHHVTISTGIPGYSEHHIGLAVDMWDHTLINPSTGQVYEGVNGHFDKTPEFAWIQEYGKEYGIIQRYPGATSRYVTGFVQEQWHFRYVGPEHAKAIMDTNYRILEHYVANQIGLFAKDSDVTLLGGTYTKIIGGSNNIGFGIYESDIHLTGKNYVTVGADATVEEITDVDAEKIIGDANGDGKVSLLDILRVLKYCIDETVAISNAADYNADMKTDIADALMILHAHLNKGN